MMFGIFEKKCDKSRTNDETIGTMQRGEKTTTVVREERVSSMI